MKRNVKKLSRYRYISGIIGISCLSRYRYISGIRGISCVSRISNQGVLEVVEPGDYLTELELSPIHFVVKFEGKFYTNVEFTNELRYVLRRLDLDSYIFTFCMYNTKHDEYSVMYTTVINVNIESITQALDISAQLAEVVYNSNIYDRTKCVKLRLRRHVINEGVLELTSSFIWCGGIKNQNKNKNKNKNKDRN